MMGLIIEFVYIRMLLKVIILLKSLGCLELFLKLCYNYVICVGNMYMVNVMIVVINMWMILRFCCVGREVECWLLIEIFVYCFREFLFLYNVLIMNVYRMVIKSRGIV